MVKKFFLAIALLVLIMGIQTASLIETLKVASSSHTFDVMGFEGYEPKEDCSGHADCASKGKDMCCYYGYCKWYSRTDQKDKDTRTEISCN